MEIKPSAQSVQYISWELKFPFKIYLLVKQTAEVVISLAAFNVKNHWI